jgi:uncharacterized protein with ParB-like and HNH nuclease domain
VKEIRGEAKSVRQLLSGTRYSIDDYQREYKWQTKQVRELIDDLTDKFMADYKTTDDRTDVQNYGHYFLGSIILSRKNNQNYIIDGQQRLTTLALLLISLHNRQGDRPDRVKLDDLIFSERFGRKSFNVEVPERARCLEALYTAQDFDSNGASESVRNIADRYRDILQHFPDEIDDRAIPFFTDWLIESVHLVEITAYSDEDAYIIFETMNDRGLSLTPLDMLKGYLLANIVEPADKERASALWKERIAELAELGKDEDADAFKAWLRSQYAEGIRERKKGALPGDFDRLGTEFHRWVREQDDVIGLRTSTEFFQFVDLNMSFYTGQYLRLRHASRHLTDSLRTVFYNARYEFTLQYPLLLAPLSPRDDAVTIDRKLRVVASFVDILIARRIWNFRTIAYSTMQYAMFLVMRDIRGCTVEELVRVLRTRLDQDSETFSANDRLRVHQQNRYVIQLLLARMTEHVERSSSLPSRFAEYVAEGKNRYEVEHIWADHPDRHTEEFAHPADFAEYRNRIGGLLLLPKSFNASYGDLPYDRKLEHYYGQNMLAKSLHPNCYDHNPGFVRYARESSLPFQPHREFNRADLDARQTLYQRLAEQIWDPDRLALEASAPPNAQSESDTAW